MSDKKTLVAFSSAEDLRVLHTVVCTPMKTRHADGEEAIRGVFREARRLHGHPLRLSGIPERVISPNEMNYSFLQTGPNLAPTRPGDQVKDATANSVS